MASATKESLGLDTLTVVADKGFDNGEHASACERDVAALAEGVRQLGEEPTADLPQGAGATP